MFIFYLINVYLIIFTFMCSPLITRNSLLLLLSLYHVRLFVTPWTVASQAPLSMGFPRQKYWSGLPFPSPGDLPNPGIKPVSTALAGRFFTTELPRKPGNSIIKLLKLEKAKKQVLLWASRQSRFVLTPWCWPHEIDFKLWPAEL